MHDWRILIWLLLVAQVCIYGVYRIGSRVQETRESLQREGHYGLQPGLVLPKASGINASRVTVISWLPANMDNSAYRRAQQTRKDWATKQGYAFWEWSHIDVNVTGFDIKPFVVKKALSKIAKGDWLIWMDADIIITNDSVRMHRHLADSHHVVVSEASGNHINNGFFAIRSSKTGFRIVKRWIAFVRKDTGWAEQELFVHAALVEECAASKKAGCMHACGPHIFAEPDSFSGFGEFRAAFTACVKVVLQGLGPLSKHPVSGTLGTTLSANTSVVAGLWGVNFMSGEWRRGDFLIHLAGLIHPFRELVTNRMTKGTLPGDLSEIYWPLAWDRVVNVLSA